MTKVAGYKFCTLNSSNVIHLVEHIASNQCVYKTKVNGIFTARQHGLLCRALY